MSDAGGGTSVAAQLRDIAVYLIEVAERSQIGDQTPRSAIPLRRTADVDDLPALAWLAQEELSERRRRNSAFDPELFGEPAWNILLDLFVAKVSGRRISVTSACIASDVPSTTALRWLAVLEDGALICRTADEYDQRRTWVALADEAFWKLAAHLRTRLAQRNAQLIRLGLVKSAEENLP